MSIVKTEYFTVKRKDKFYGYKRTIINNKLSDDSEFRLDFEDLSKIKEYNCFAIPSQSNDEYFNNLFTVRLYSFSRKDINNYINEIIIPKQVLNKFV